MEYLVKLEQAEKRKKHLDEIDAEHQRQKKIVDEENER